MDAFFWHTRVMDDVCSRCPATGYRSVLVVLLDQGFSYTATTWSVTAHVMACFGFGDVKSIPRSVRQSHAISSDTSKSHTQNVITHAPCLAAPAASGGAIRDRGARRPPRAQ